ADTLLSNLNIIPFEGATDTRQLYREAKLMQCIAAMKSRKYKKALFFIHSAKAWPENLGIGKPYREDIDERLEDWLTYECDMKLGNTMEAQRILQDIIAFIPKKENATADFSPANTLISAWALEKINKKEEATRLLNEWQQKNPADKSARWARGVFENHRVPATPEITKEDESIRILEALLSQ
ncbi:MAG: DUF5107 domain-containing protein, partial [Bacteroidota bacterium]